MAKIRAVERGGRYTVSVQGPLEAFDLRRLERACGKALEREVVPLVLHLDTAVTDDVARAYLDRLHARGAVIRLCEVAAGQEPIWRGPGR